jgi:hypothetical protein
MQRKDTKENIRELRGFPLAFFETAVQCARGKKYTIKNPDSIAHAQELGLLDETNGCKPETLAAFINLDILHPRKQK